MDTLLITGATGFLGARAAAYYARRYNVRACGHGALDITDGEAVLRYFAKERPRYVLHCAAISDTARAAGKPDLAWTVNVTGTRNIAHACAAVGAKLVLCSSDQIYNGSTQTTPLREKDTVMPETPYGLQKLAAEQAAAEKAPSAVCLRLTWMYALPYDAMQPVRGLLFNLIRAAQSNTPLCAPVRERRGFTYVWDAVERLEACFSLAGGVYNFGSGATHNSYDFFVYAAQLLGLSPALIQPDEARYPAHMRNLAMDGARLAAEGIVFPDSAAALRAALGVS